MSIYSKLLFPVAYNLSETDTCYSAVFKTLFLLFFLRVSQVNSFLYLKINYMLFDEILLGKENNHSDISLCPSRSAHNFQTFLVPQINLIVNKLAIFIALSGQQQC